MEFLLRLLVKVYMEKYTLWCNILCLYTYTYICYMHMIHAQYFHDMCRCVYKYLCKIIYTHCITSIWTYEIYQNVFSKTIISFIMYIHAMYRYIHMKDPKTWTLFIKKCVFILTCLNSVTFKVLSFDAMRLLRFFSTAQNSFWTLWFWCLLVLLLLFHLFHVSKPFPFEDFFHAGNKKVTWGEIVWTGRMVARGHAGFGQTLLDTV